MMHKKITFAFLILLSFIFAPSQAEKLSCEIIEVNQKAPFYLVHYPKSFLKHEIQSTKVSTGCVEAKAKGIVGEILARKNIEENIRINGKPLISILTYFSGKGCRLKESFHDGADHGIDDIFVVLGEDGKIDRGYDPVFHEAKFDGHCHLKLNTTKAICKQLSFQWLNYHIKKLHERTLTGLDICFSSKQITEIIPCYRCQSEFLAEAIWLKNSLNAGHFYRTASVLCSNGTLKIYNLSPQQQAIHLSTRVP